MMINRLKGKITEAGYTQRTLAQKLNMSKNTLNSKVNGKTSFNISEIEALCAILGITDNSEKAQIFLS